MTLETFLDNQKASVDPVLQLTAPPLKWFDGALDDEYSKQQIKAAGEWPYIQFIQGDEVPTSKTHNGKAVKNCPSYFNIFLPFDDGATPDEREITLWFDFLSALPSHYQAWGIDELGKTATAKLIAINMPNATNRRPRKVQAGLLMATVYVNLLIFRP